MISHIQRAGVQLAVGACGALARAVAGDEGLRVRAEAEVEEIIALPRGRAKILADAAEMRALLEEEKPARDLWDLKLLPGGLS